MKYFTLLISFCVFTLLHSQEDKKYNGEFTLGIRSTTSFFDNTNDGRPGLGTGGNFRIRLSDRVNTDWFADYIFSTTSLLKRADYHIGWSVLYYPFTIENKGFRPYVLAGHCFDYSELTELANYSNNAHRLSSAIQGGIGTHYYFTERLDATVQFQYMMHLGTHLHADIHEDGDVHFHTEKGAMNEGHLLFTVGLNYTLGKLWGRK